MAKQIIVNVVLTASGSVNRAATDAAYFDLRDKLDASLQEDQSSVAEDITAFLLRSPGLRTIPTSSLVRNLWDARNLSGVNDKKSHSEKEAAFSRLEEIVPEYVKANPKMFHMGRKTGIAIRFVPGEVAVDPKTGEDMFDEKTGEPVQAYRHTDEEWTKLTAKANEKKSETNGAASASA
jgi:hypothetical protein